MEPINSQMTISVDKPYHIVLDNLYYFTNEEDLKTIFRKYGVKQVAIQRKKSKKKARVYLKFISVDCADIVHDLMLTNSIHLHAKQLQLKYNDYYNKVEITPPVLQDIEKNSILNILPIEIISKIIEYLPHVDQARLERVSKLWRLASLSTHCKMKHFEIDNRWPSGWCGEEFTRKCFYWLMNRSKNYVRSLKLTERTVLSDLWELLGVAVRTCPNLEKVDLKEILLTPTMVKELYLIASRLTVLSLGTSTFSIDSELIEVFKKAKKLVKLRIVETVITGESLTFLNVNLKTLIIDNCEYMESSYMCEAIKRLQSLEHLEIISCEKMNDTVLRTIVYNTSISKTMKTLKLSYLPNPKRIDVKFLPRLEHNESYISYDKIGPASLGILLVKRYTNITQLALKFCTWVTKEVVSEIAENLLQLEYLDLSGCSNIIGTFALDPLVKLKNITVIKLNHLHFTVGGSVLKEFKKLKEVSCRNSLGFDNRAICEAIMNCPYLSVIIIEDCVEIGISVIQCALSTVRNNKRTSPLVIYVADSGICESTFMSNDSLKIYYNRLIYSTYLATVPYNIVMARQR
ncbi:uncharacterized protein LOC122533661 [Frieseomelitta varia]|uniref:uncharacterized protein LOC122533661 n=1 Tax=Frieseomelitta varia TaxID=561572 RepID=UPI001CB68BA3|nr:uncharacterized protein LOC122533661 [Frieseomelitta varia]